MLSLHHLALTSANLKKSSEFYDAILKPFGYQRHYTSEDVCSWTPPENTKNMPEFLVYAGETDQVKNEHKLYDPGIHHFCFRIERKKLVDEVFEIARNFEVEILDEPAEYPRYAKNVGSKSYYAVYFNDPDNIKLEFVAME
jgi:catechol 2,3-dioxygenase-like lactoylglutathione lyase family enzyme